MVFKVQNKEDPTHSDIAKFQTEYAITNAVNVPGVIRADTMEKLANRRMIVFKDPGGNFSAKVFALQ